VHTHSFSAQNIDAQAQAVVRRARLPWVWTVHGFFEIPAVEIKKWRSAYELARHGKLRITADSNYLLQLVKTEALQGAEMKVVYPGTDTSMFGHAEPSLEWRARHGIPASAVLLGSTGRLAHVKGFDVLIRAASHLIQTRSNAYFVIAGSGELMDELQKQVAANGMTDRFKLLGFMEDLPFYLSQLDVFVLASRSEGFPVSLLEALASGLPCVATRVGGVPEMLEQGIVVPPEDPQALAQAMASLLEPTSRRSLASHSREIVARYSMDRCAQEFKKIYDDLLSF
jgi:glycosyltransferase involved in cell wall biosynthesis